MNMSFSSEGCKQIEEKTILLRNNKLKIYTVNIILSIFTNIIKISNYNSY
jgi:hypothetical protein